MISDRRGLFRAQLNGRAINDIRLALNRNRPLGNSRFYAKIEPVTGQRRGAGRIGVVISIAENNVSLS